MPSKYRIKPYLPDTFYHVYNRGIEKRNVFMEAEDYGYFLQQFKRYLGNEGLKDKRGMPFKDLSQQVELVAFCLMPNHFHLLIYQHDVDGMKELLQRAMTSYSMYFNKKYPRVGSLFQDRYKASPILEDKYIWHISRYIHLNPLDISEDYQHYPYSSYQYYLGNQKAKWLSSHRVLGMFSDEHTDYAEFVADYVDYKNTLDEIRHDLAHE